MGQTGFHHIYAFEVLSLVHLEFDGFKHIGLLFIELFRCESMFFYSFHFDSEFIQGFIDFIIFHGTHDEHHLFIGC